MGRIYVAPLAAIVTGAADADQDLWELDNNTTKRLILHAFSLTGTLLTDERIALRLVTRTNAAGTGSTATSVAVDTGNSVAATAVLKTIIATPDATGLAVRESWQWSQQGELLYLPTPEIRPVIQDGRCLCLNLGTSVVARTFSGHVIWEEE